MSDLTEHADVALELLVERIPKIVERDAPEPTAYALAVCLELTRGDWFRWLPLVIVMQQRRVEAAGRLGVDPRVAYWDPWGVAPGEWARPWEISHGTAGVIAGVAGDLSASPRAARVFEPLQDAWLDASEPTVDGLLFEEWFGIQLAHRLDQVDWSRIINVAAGALVVFAWPEGGRASPALRASVRERHRKRLASHGVWPP